MANVYTASPSGEGRDPSSTLFSSMPIRRKASVCDQSIHSAVLAATVAAFVEAAQSTVSVYPTNYTSGTFTPSGGTGACGLASARRVLQAVSENPSTFTIAASQSWHGVTIVVRPLF